MSTHRFVYLCALVVSASSVAASDYASTVRKDAPVVWWRFDELDQDRASDEQHLKLHGRYLNGTMNRRGVSGLAAGFERSNRAGRVEVTLDPASDAALEGLFNSSFTLEFWLRDEAAAPDNVTNYSLFYKADRSAFTRNSLWLYRARQDGDYHFRIQGKGRASTGLSIVSPGGSNSAGDRQWHHLAITALRDKKRNALHAFFDGRLVGVTEAPDVHFDNSGPLIIGNSHHRNSPWQGDLDELAIYDRALSETAIRDHFEAGRDSLNTPTSTPPSLAAREEFFELHIRPLLIEKCADCHSGGSSAESSLSVMSRTALLQGGDFGQAVVAGRAEDSVLMHAVKRIHKELKMPPDAPLKRAEIAALERWINTGAIWPESETEPPSATQVVSNAGGPTTKDSFEHWSLQPRRAVSPPEVDEIRWNRTPIDQFVEAARRKANVSAVEPADRRTLIRRATFDLIGLPPSPEEVDAFVDDPRDDTAAFADVVDRLLSSKHYGERQGRQWLDVARYADTQGDVGDIPIPQAYLYRNWVIDALNADLPYDVFLQRQIAGDILAAEVSDPEEARQLIIATGFVALSRRFGNTKKDDLHLTIEDTLDTLGRGVLGLTLRCARCHDHKFDPILQTNYYGLYGIFESTNYPWMGMSNEKSPSALAPALPDVATKEKAEEYWKLITRYEYQINNHFRPWLKPTLDEYRQVRQQLEQPAAAGDVEGLKAKREELLGRHSGRFRELMIHGLNWIKSEKKRLAENPEIEFLFAVSDGRPRDARLHRRGNVRNPGAAVARHVPPFIAANGSLEIQKGSGRLELARWITRPDHPLTARVIVNRIWQQHFGRGLVETTDNFGKQGTTPTHPELLDWLAEQFVRDGQSLKKLHRRIMLTETYRLSSAESSVGQSSDPENIWLWRHSPRRLDAEQIRDAMLAVSGQLDRSQGGPHPFKPWYAVRYSLNSPFHEEYPTNRRSVYLMTQRLFRHSFLGLFDGPDTNSSTSQRGSASVPAQALYLMNSSFVKAQAESLADRLERLAVSDRERIERLYRLALGRSPDANETELLLGFLADYRDSSGTSAGSDAFVGLCRAVITSNEFFFVD